MHEVPLGDRVAITANDGTYLGLGTYIGDISNDDMAPMLPDFLLDSGVCILGNQCSWTSPGADHPLPPIPHVLGRKQLLLVRNGEGVSWSGESLPEGTEIEITRFIVLYLDGEGMQVVATYDRDGSEYFLLMRDIDFPTYGDT